jgi:hypothetical protein
VLTDHPALRERLITAIVPEALQSTVDHAVTTLPTSAIPFAIGLIGLLLSGTGVVFSAYQTLNHVAAVPYRLRAGFFSRYLRVFAILAMLLLGALAVGTLTVVATALPSGRPRCSGPAWSSSRSCCPAPVPCSPARHRCGPCGPGPSWARWR